MVAVQSRRDPCGRGFRYRAESQRCSVRGDARPRDLRAAGRRIAGYDADVDANLDWSADADSINNSDAYAHRDAVANCERLSYDNADANRNNNCDINADTHGDNNFVTDGHRDANRYCNSHRNSDAYVHADSDAHRVGGANRVAYVGELRSKGGPVEQGQED